MVRFNSATRRRRRLRFHSLAQVLQEAESLNRAEHVERLGNWTLGQIFQHLAKSFHSSMEESQAELPLWNRALAKLGKPVFLRWGLPRGVQLESYGKVVVREFLPEDQVAQDIGLRQLREAIQAIYASDLPARHNLFGRMSREEWLKMHCRHAELHLSFLIPSNPETLPDNGQTRTSERRSGVVAN